ncbi:guanitoxin biosynthesis heme-dependent pre-guanitoxin N-hydroxylase GntA [Methyloligella solikamskensis]|uniref:Guanitoxin biosynthesis heme-dependent pre-guanitoxin N-hydroxylase GntA n=1 Tax=Methyloligella solikamskensis TaxID=1177756 RepID=A0ABW3J7L2_9HYPH
MSCLESTLPDKFQAFVANPAFPCVGAKAALSRDQMRIFVAGDISSNRDDPSIWRHLRDQVNWYRISPSLFQSCVILFEEPTDLSEEGFEACLWERLRSLSDEDVAHGQRHDARVSADPEDPHFSMSFAGEAFFVVGLHPNASRPARRFEVPGLVFNLHDQFEQLRRHGQYDRLRSSILARDISFSGSRNPMLSRHGEISEARQYSGRAVGPGWQCPLQTRRADELESV